jgi:uncharacterized small protein (DUF1192 family)
MSTADSRTIEGLVNQVEARERSARRRTLLFTLVPIVLAILLLAYISTRIVEYNRELDKLRAELEAKQAQLAAVEAKLSATERRLSVTQKQLVQAERQLKATTNLARYAHPVDYRDMKDVANTLPSSAATTLFDVLLATENEIPWKLNGRTPSQGFDSPGFAYYMLTDGLSIGTSLVIPIKPEQSAREHLCGKLRRVSKPLPGDLACYLGGYTMFYFKDAKGEPFVVGMTPKGVVALDPDFAGSPDYHFAGISRE